MRWRCGRGYFLSDPTVVREIEEGRFRNGCPSSVGARFLVARETATPTSRRNGPYEDSSVHEAAQSVFGDKGRALEDAKYSTKHCRTRGRNVLPAHAAGLPGAGLEAE